MGARQLTTAGTIIASGALLFLLQPMMAKALLPRFGGSAGVWVACMMFFQIVLLLGYLYVFWTTRYLSPRIRTVLHIGLLAASFAVLQLRLHTERIGGNPMLAILLILASTIGLPFLLLSTTSPLLQAWHTGPFPYTLFAVSNAACLAALLAYPIAIEPAITVTEQLRWWTIGYIAVAALLVVAAIRNRNWTLADKPDAGERDSSTDRPVLWISLAACASALWLAVANHLSQEVAPIPFLWVLPMSAYLLTFVIAFASDGWYRPRVFRWLLPPAWVAIGSRTGVGSGAAGLRFDIVLSILSLFVVCLFCHGELARRRPIARQRLPFFYVMVAAGGALGGIFVGLAAPAAFSSYLEFPIAVAAAVVLAAPLVYGVTSRGHLIRLAVLAIVAVAVSSNLRLGDLVVARNRNFYGMLEVRDVGAGDLAVRALYNGRTVHGVQFLNPSFRRTPTAYYGPQSGIGLLLDRTAATNRRVAIIGLGAGSLAAYGRRGDSFRFYEINPAVVQAASTYFHFLADSEATVDIVTGDGRLRLAESPAHSFDLIVLDAFSDDAIPVHLLTREAFELYFAHLRDGGALAIHITNRYLDLAPVVESLASACGKTAMFIHNRANASQQTLAADWAVVSDSPAIVTELRRYADSGPHRAGPLWTDDYSNLFQIWR